MHSSSFRVILVLQSVVLLEEILGGGRQLGQAFVLLEELGLQFFILRLERVVLLLHILMCPRD